MNDAHLHVLYFAQAAEIAGCRVEHWAVGSALTESEFWEEAIRRHPGLKALRSECRLAVDQAFLTRDKMPIQPHSEVAVLPPVSGG